MTYLCLLVIFPGKFQQRFAAEILLNNSHKCPADF